MGAAITLPQNATIASVITGLKNPIEYVRSVLEVLVGLHGLKNPSDFLIYISIQSDPAAPDYRIFEIMDEDSGTTISVRSGRTHKEMNYKKADSLIWSQESFGVSELQELLGALRKAAKS